MAGLIIDRRSGSIVDNKSVTAPATTGEATDVPLFVGIFIKLKNKFNLFFKRWLKKKFTEFIRFNKLKSLC